MVDERDDVKKLIQLAVPHDFGATLRYIDNKANELLSILSKTGPVAKYVPKYNFEIRLHRIKNAVSLLDQKFDEFWDTEAYHNDYAEMQQAFDISLAPLLTSIIKESKGIGELLLKTSSRHRAIYNDYFAERSLSIAEEAVNRMIYFSNRSLYYVRGLVDLYNFAHIENVELTNLNKFFSQMNEFFHLADTREEIKIVNNLPTIRVDYSHCYTLFSNLIKNSLKYKRGAAAAMSVLFESSSAGPSVFASRIPRYVPVGRLSDGFSAIHFFDEGIGIQPEKLRLIFRPFKRGIERDEAAALAGRERHGQHNGKDEFSYSDMGIGLAMAMRVATLYGGDIYASSAPGIGACITVTLPKELIC
ncbi:MAG TPA: ATP-binding protein [Allosphingosinicella sp.]